MNGLLERSMAKFIIYPVIRQLCRFHRVLRCPSRKPSPRGKSDQWIYSFSFYRIVHRKRMIGFSGSMCPVHFRFDSLSTRIDFFFEFPFLLCFSSSSLHLFFETYIQRIVQINFNCVFFSFFFMQCIFSFFQILQWLLFLHWYKKTIFRNILGKENWSIIRIINKGMWIFTMKQLFVLIRLKILDNAVRTCLVSQTSDLWLSLQGCWFSGYKPADTCSILAISLWPWLFSRRWLFYNPYSPIIQILITLQIKKKKFNVPLFPSPIKIKISNLTLNFQLENIEQTSSILEDILSIFDFHCNKLFIIICQFERIQDIIISSKIALIEIHSLERLSIPSSTPNHLDISYWYIIVSYRSSLRKKKLKETRFHQIVLDKKKIREIPFNPSTPINSYQRSQTRLNPTRARNLSKRNGVIFKVIVLRYSPSSLVPHSRSSSFYSFRLQGLSSSL